MRRDQGATERKTPGFVALGSREARPGGDRTRGWRVATDLDATAHAEGTVSLFLDPGTAAPVDTPIELPLVIDRSVTVDADESSGDLAVVDEIDEQEIGSESSSFRHRYVIDRRDLVNVEDERAFAYEEGNVTDRPGSYSINLPFDSDDESYPIWKNEIAAAYDFERVEITETVEPELEDLVGYRGSVTDAPVIDAYVEALAPQGIPEGLTLEQLRPQLEAAGIDLDALVSALLPRLWEQDRTALLGIAAAPVPLTYLLSVETEIRVEPRTGAIVDLHSIEQAVSARPDAEVLEQISGILERYPDVPEAVTGATALDEIASGPPTPVFEISYAQTPESVTETLELANDLAGQASLAESTIPIGLLVAGIVLVLAGAVGVFLGGRRSAPAAPTPREADPGTATTM